MVTGGGWYIPRCPASVLIVCSPAPPRQASHHRPANVECATANVCGLETDHKWQIHANF